MSLKGHIKLSVHAVSVRWCQYTFAHIDNSNIPAEFNHPTLGTCRGVLCGGILVWYATKFRHICHVSCPHVTPSCHPRHWGRCALLPRHHGHCPVVRGQWIWWWWLGVGGHSGLFEFCETRDFGHCQSGRGLSLSRPAGLSVILWSSLTSTVWLHSPLKAPT